MSSPRLIVLVPVALAAWLSRAAARAADDQPATLRQEIAGVELAPLAVGTETAVLGYGGTLRFGRHRWPGTYWTPIQAGVFAGGEGLDQVIIAKLQTEGGFVFHSPIGAVELGLGAGAGILLMENAPYGCDGTCWSGGRWMMVSPVLRYLFRDRPTHTVGIFIRGEVPVGSAEGGGSHITDHGMAFLFGLDLAGGRGSAERSSLPVARPD
jgi:hypothetical protein